MNPLYLAMMQQQGQQSSPMPGMPTSAPTDPLQMMPQQPASPSYTNPFDSGISKAIEGARASVALSQAQKQDAFSKSLSAFAAALSQPQQQDWGDNPRSAMMRQLGTSLAPGMQTYNQAEDQARQENLGMADYMVKLKSTQDEALRKALKEQLNRQHQEDVLEETKRHHGAQEKKQELMLQLKNLKTSHLTRAEEKQRKEEEERRLEDEAIARGETPLSVLEKPARADYQKNALKTIRDRTPNNNNIKALQKMRKIFKDNPGIGSSYNNLLVGEGKESGFWNTLGRNVADKKKLAAAQELHKLTSSINFGTIMDVSGKTATNMMKQIIKDKGVHKDLEDSAFYNISDDLERQFLHKIDLAKKYEDGLRRKVMISDEEEVPVSFAEEQRNTSGSKDTYGGMIKMLDAEGNPLDVPSEDVDEVLRLGGRHVH